MFLKCASFKQYFRYVILWDRYINVLYGRIHKMLLEQYKSLQFSTVVALSNKRIHLMIILFMNNVLQTLKDSSVGT